MTTIAFLGLGAMGSRMAGNLIAKGFSLTVWNRTPEAAAPLAERGARVAASPRAAAKGADIVFSMVRDDAASAAVWLDPEAGALSGIREGALAIECSTLSLAQTARVHAAGAARGVDVLDAPVAGSRPQADARQLIFLVGGEAEALEVAQPALEAMGAAIHHAGRAGAGMAVKLAVNELLAVQVAALAELTGFLARAGVAPDRGLAIIAETPVASPSLKGAAASMTAGAYAPMFPAALAEKDLAFLAASGADAPMAEAARAVMARAMAAGYGGDHLTGVARLYA
jgi:3-hydroxyisobutyrate dehydrogenase